MPCDWSSDVCSRSEEHTSELQSHSHLVCRLLLEKKLNIAHHVSHSQPIRHDSARAGRAPHPGPPSRSLPTVSRLPPFPGPASRLIFFYLLSGPRKSSPPPPAPSFPG